MFFALLLGHLRGYRAPQLLSPPRGVFQRWMNSLREGRTPSGDGPARYIPYKNMISRRRCEEKWRFIRGSAYHRNAMYAVQKVAQILKPEPACEDGMTTFYEFQKYDEGPSSIFHSSTVLCKHKEEFRISNTEKS